MTVKLKKKKKKATKTKTQELINYVLQLSARYLKQGHLAQKTTDALATKTKKTSTVSGKDHCFQMETVSNIHLQTCFHFPGERRISHTQPADSLSLEYRRAHVVSVGSYPLAYKSPERFPS